MRIRDEYLHGSDLTGVVKKIEVTTGTGSNANKSIIKYTKADSADSVVEVPIGDITGKAATASKLDNTSAIGSKINPVYFTANGVPSACTYSLNATVPVGAANQVLYYSALNTLDTQSYTTLTSNLDVFTAATASAAGKKGLVPAPAANQLGAGNFFLRADGVWTVIESKSAALNGTATSLVTTGEKYNWNSAYNWYNSMTSGDTDGIINKWKEVEAFLANYGDSSTLAAELAKLVTLSTDQTITGVKTFSEVINGSITGNAGTANKFKNTVNINGVAFDGSSDITIIAEANGGNSDTVGGYSPSDFLLKAEHETFESIIATALTDLDNRKIEASDIPTSLPANGGNADTATKLQTARTIWGLSFDGTGNVSGALTDVTDISASGHANVKSLKTKYICIECDASGNVGKQSSEINNYSGPIYLQYSTSNDCRICQGGGNVVIGANSGGIGKLQVEGDIYTTSGFHKKDSSDSYVLLGGGGHKAISDFATAYHTHSNYLERLVWWSKVASHNADNLTTGITFAYTTHNVPVNGTIVAFSCTGGDYQLLLQGQYNGENLWFRNKDGDNGTWNNWRYVIHNGNIGSQSVNYATSAESAIKSDYLTTRYIGSDGDTVAQVKLKILDSYTSLAGKQGYSIRVNSAFIHNYTLDDYVLQPNSIYSLTYLTPEYDGKGYGQWLASCLGSMRLYVFGRDSYLWTERKTIAWTSDIPTKVSSFTNDAGYLTSHAYSYGSIDIYDINGAKKTSNNTVSASVNTETLRLQEGANIAITATNSGTSGGDSIKIAVTDIISNIDRNGYGQLALWYNGAPSVSATLQSSTYNEKLTVKAGSGIDFSGVNGTANNDVWTISAIPYNCAITLNNNSTKSLIKDSWSADKDSVYLTSDGTSSGTSLVAGTYTLWIEDRSSSSGTPNYYSGTFTCAGSATAGRLDEIALHSSMATSADTNAPTRIFVATQISGTSGKHVLRFCSLDSSTTNHYLTVKVNRII